MWDRLSFGWISTRLFRGYTSKTRFSDDFLYKELGSYRHYDVDHFWRSIWQYHKTSLIISFLLKAFSEFLTVKAVSVMRSCTAAIKVFRQDYTQDYSHILRWSLLLLAIQLANTFCLNHQEYLLLRIGLACRRSLMSQIFGKAVSSKKPTDEGRLVNLITTDTVRIGAMFEYLHYIWSAPFQAVLIFYQMYQVIGSGSFLGMSLMIIYLPIQLWTTGCLKRLRIKVSIKSDCRIKFLEQILRNIKYIKTSGLESFFSNHCVDLRKFEWARLRIYHISRSFSSSLAMFFHLSAGMATLLYLMFFRKETRGEDVVAIIMLFKLLRTQLNMIPIIMNALANGSVAISRIKCLESHGLYDNSVEVTQDGDSLILNWGRKDAIIPFGSVVSIQARNPAQLKMFSNSLCVALKDLGKKVVLCGSKPWLQNKSIRENVVFGEVFNSSLYNRSVSVTCLDLELSDIGHDQLIVQMGSNLSGGQRQRISLARAVYSQAPICIMEYPLSALDLTTAEFIINRCILGEMAGRTRFVLGNFPKADIIIDLSLGSSRSTESQIHFEDENSDSRLESFQVSKLPDKPQESQRYGGIPIKIVWKWLRLNGGWLFIFIILILLILNVQCRHGNDLLMVNRWEETPGSKDVALTIAYRLGQIVLSLCISLIFSMRSIWTASVVHNQAILSVLSFPLLEFNDRPAGAVVNRLSKDQEGIDNALIISVVSLSIMSAVLVNQLKIMLENDLRLIWLIALVLGLFALIAQYYRWSLREAKRAEASSRTPICNLLAEANSGLLIIYGLGKDGLLKREMNEFIDVNSSHHLFSIAAQVWFILRFEILGAFLTFGVAWFCAFGSLQPAMISLILSYSSQLPSMSMWLIRQLALTENNMISFERIVDLIDDGQDSEVTSIKRCAFEKPPSVAVKNVSADFGGKSQYLNSLSVKFEAGKRTAIIGRTGSGKSSLLLAIMGVYPISSGSIMIDDEDIKSIDVRSQASYVAQEPMLFVGETVRFNVDPTDAFTDSEIYAIFKQLEIDFCLDQLITDDMPLGSLELLSLCRALLTRSKLILLDEPLASLDSSKLTSLLPAISELTTDPTVILVTHRPEFIKWSDHCLQMAEGRLKPSFD